MSKFRCKICDLVYEMKISAIKAHADHHDENWYMRIGQLSSSSSKIFRPEELSKCTVCSQTRVLEMRTSRFRQMLTTDNNDNIISLQYKCNTPKRMYFLYSWNSRFSNNSQTIRPNSRTPAQSRPLFFCNLGLSIDYKWRIAPAQHANQI